MPEIHRCRCGNEIKGPYRTVKRYCSRKCQLENYKRRAGMKGYGLPTGTTGAIQELRVSADLLLRGYEVFRAVSPSCSCDLAILKDGALKRIEVRTGYENQNTGNIMFPASDARKYEVLAIVLKDRIIYRPEL